ncbi:MAG: efflux RND transporter periplasmic adaptor subunit [Acidobacteria bacterium]|nr:efflux RND transporter periplasmic adaptor subunit [Acidobacteriota bacterium]
MRRYKWVLGVVVLLALAALLLARRNSRGTIEVVLEPTTLQSVFRSSVNASGEIIATRYADIGSSVMGRIVSLRVSEGDPVKAGQVLAVIDPVQARADLAAAEAAIEAQAADARGAELQARAADSETAAAEARLRDATVVLARARDLHAQALVPKADLDAAQATFDATEAQLAAARASAERARSARAAALERVSQVRAQAARARDVVSKTEISAPIDGVVSRLVVREGEMVVIGIQNQPGTTLMTISDLSAINAEVKVAEADVLRLAVGQPAAIVLEAMPGRRFAGRVVEVGASALPVVGTVAAAREFRVVVRLDEADPGLRPGLTCDAEILAEERRNVVTAPLQAVVLRPGAGADGLEADRTGVFVVEGETARFRPVDTGIIGGLAIEVRGVESSTPVVSGPFQALRELRDGAPVRVRRDPPR